MNYDIKEHLGMQIEQFLNAYNTGNIELLERSLDNIKDILEASEVNIISENVSKWDEDKKKQIDKIFNKSKNAIKTILESDDPNFFVDIEEIKTDVVNSISMVENDYWESVRKMVLKSVYGINEKE